MILKSRIANKRNYTALTVSMLFFVGFIITGCKIYKFNDASFPTNIKTVKVNIIENRASYVNPQLSPRLTDKLRQKLTSQTKLKQTNDDRADWVISGTITSYSFSTSGISQQQVATNRLNVAVHISVNDQVENKTNEYDVSRNFDFAANLSFQQAEASLGDKIITGLTDDIFNRLFSTW